RIAPCAVGLPNASTTASTGPGSSSAASAGVRSAATSTPWPAAAGAVPPSSARSTWSPSARTSAARARWYGAGSRASSAPLRPPRWGRGGRRRLADGHPVAALAEQLGVVEQQQVCVEDLGVGLARPPRGAGPDLLHLAPDCGDGRPQPAPLGSRVLGAGVRHLERLRPPRPRRADPDPRGGGHSEEARAPFTGPAVAALTGARGGVGRHPG